jgi:hypothetical protein
MPYEGEYAQYKPLKRLVNSERVKALLKRAKIRDYKKTDTLPLISASNIQPSLWQPDWVLAVDGSHHEEFVKNGFPGAEVSYITIASVMLDMAKVRSLDQYRPVNPVEFRKTEQSESIDSALPGCNVILDDDLSARTSLRKAIYEIFENAQVFPDCETLLDTYEALLKNKPPKTQKCPYTFDDVCISENHSYHRGCGAYVCDCKHKRQLYSTDALRIYERMSPAGSNGEVFGEIMQVLERLWIIHILRSLEQKGWLSVLSRLAIVLDGPLAVFGHPAWLSQAIRLELMRINEKAKSWTGGQHLLMMGIEKSGAFVNHFLELDKNEEGVNGNIESRQVFLLTDSYIKENIIFSTSSKPYGQDTYFGRKLFYKTVSGAMIVASLPFLDDFHRDLDKANTDQFPRLPDALALLDQLASSRYPNALAPIISAHAEAAIPLNLGKRVLAEIAKQLMRK